MVFQIILLWLLYSSLALKTTAQICHQNDILALKEFKGNLTSGSIITTWSNETNCCVWEGVVCENNRVIKLNVSKQGLKGSIPHSFRNLDQLKILDLSFNKLSGPIWEALSGLTRIQTVNISSNLFIGNFTDFPEFKSLETFNISNNSFTGQFYPRLCNTSKKLKILDISLNLFIGGLEVFDNCSVLERLHVDLNSFSGQIPESVYSMVSLNQLSISSNHISGTLSSKLSNLTNLKSLLINSNQFSGSLPNVFDKLPQLEQFIANSNKFSGLLPSSLSLCSKLRNLNLQNNSLSGSVVLNFTKLSHLINLDLASNRFSGHLPETLSNCKELKTLSLAKNKFSGPIPESYSSLTSLGFLSLSNNSLINLTASLSALEKCENLTTLILSKNFHGEEMPILNKFGFGRKLMLFALGNCGLRGEIPIWLKKCMKLEILDLSWNHLEGEIPNWIGEMDHLFYLDFSNNSLSGEFPKSLTKLKSLTSSKNCVPTVTSSTGIPLFVKRNRSGSGLQYNQVSNFPPSILLSNNKMNGTILPEIGQLKQLHVLDLSRNNLSGPIPDSISNMSNLEGLDLSNNDLTGTIPQSLNILTFLSRFSVANNHLNGPIPTGGQFFSFSSSSFEGNSGLCGKIISPCTSINNSGLRAPPGARGPKRGRILGITISVIIGVAFVLTILLVKISRRDIGHPIEDMDDENSRRPRLSDGIGNGNGNVKLVLFPGAECKEITIMDLLKSTNNFNQSNIIGCGGFGLVFKADMPDGSKAAIKRLSGECGQIEREFQAEVEALSRAQHKNLVSLQGYCLRGSDRLLIYSYMENGSLDYWLHEKVDGSAFLKWETRLKIAQGSARGLAYLHKEPNIIHRDIKTSNILLDERFEPHLADFGLSRLLRNPYDTHVTTDLVGTLGYIPPEYSQTLTATFRGDVYSFGVVLLELLTGRRPVEVCKGKNCRNVVSWVFQMKYEKREEEVFDSIIWNKEREIELLETLSVACRCLDQDPRKRPSIDQVVSWLDGIGKEKISDGLL